MRNSSFCAAGFVLVFILTLVWPMLVSCSMEESEAPSERAEKSTSTTNLEAPGDSKSTAESPEGRKSPRPYPVPVAHLSSPLESIGLEDLTRETNLYAPRGMQESLSPYLEGANFESLDSSEAVVERVSHDPDALGLLSWDAASPRVKVLAVDGLSPLSPGADLESYPLAPEGSEDLWEAPDPESLKRVVIGGDVVLDRGLPYSVFQLGRGMSFPLDGGYAAITERYAEPSDYSESGEIHTFSAERRGGTGAVRKYLNEADLTLANLENPVLANPTYHARGTTFHGDLRLLPVVLDAGLDGVTLSNNHILDAGETGLSETTTHLEEAGVAYTGAGPDEASARAPMIFDLGGVEGVKVGVLGALGVPGSEWSWATETSAGTAPLREDTLKRDVEELSEVVDVVIVTPHWGEEYTATPEPEQRRLARLAVDSGADLVVGGHAHWAKGVEVYDEAPIFYGVGNFIFDQVWSEETSTGVFAEVTLFEDQVIQSRPVPFITLDYGQPNFLLPDYGGERADGVFSSSRGPEFEALRENGP